jgi:undecaprenyl-diphosphatase
VVSGVETAKRHAAACALCCAVLLLVVWVLAYYVAPFEELDETVLNAISTPSGSPVHDLAFTIEQVMEPAGWAAAATVAFLLAAWQGRYKRALLAVALILGTALVDLTLKAVFEHERELSIPIDEFEWLPLANAFPSGHSAGALAISLAFLFVVPAAWQRVTAALGLVFTLAVSLGLLVLNYHYPSDIVGGWLVALGWCFALIAVDADRESTSSEEAGG